MLTSRATEPGRGDRQPGLRDGLRTLSRRDHGEMKLGRSWPLRPTLQQHLVTREQRGVAHLLIVTTRHAPSLLNLNDLESEAIMRLTRTAARAIDCAEQRPGISVWQNNGVDAHQAIPHFHVHVAGTMPEGGTNWGDVHEISIDSTDAIASKLRPFL